MKTKGRPPQSEIRQNMIELLHVLGSAYGYQLSKLYADLFPSATRRVIYYHLQKGVSLGEFEVDRVEHETGDFSWGSVAEKTYYKLGKNAKPRGDPRVKAVVVRK
jgi:hypothetical protein